MFWNIEDNNVNYFKRLGDRLALVNIFIKPEKHSVPEFQLILQSVPGKGWTFLVKYVRVHGNTLSPST